MRILIVLFIIFLYKSSSGESHSARSGSFESSSGQKQEYRVLKEFTHSHFNAHVWLIVHEEEHMVGQPFQVELRVQCDLSMSEVNVMELPIEDSFSVCDIDPKSVVINSAQTGIAMKTKSVDISDYNNQISLATVDIKPKCARDTTIKYFSLENLCN